MSELLETSVLYKTEAGVLAVKNRSAALSQKASTLLILIDGKKTVKDMYRFSPDVAQVKQWLDELQTAGMISVDAPAPTAATAVAGAGAATASGSASAPAAAMTPKEFQLAVRKATRALEDLLGPSSEALCLQIEKCKNMDELSAKVRDLHKVVTTLRSATKADEFVAKALST